ncbi:MAG TPA: hypothetical protein VHO47_03700 [Candidatus Babeliales bacterium]|nr:hypothetical protein [Candidatus Babeliales bacterium]
MDKFTIVLIALSIPFSIYCQLHLNIKQEWKRIGTTPTSSRYESFWLLACTIEFKKKKTDIPLFLEKLLISWKGAHIEHLHGSLYKKPLINEFFPFQENLLCESSWNRQKQQIIFRLNAPIVLGAETTLCLVLSITQKFESILKTGYFEFERNTLPELLQGSLPDKTFIFAYR